MCLIHAVTGYDKNPGNNYQIYTYYRKLGKNTTTKVCQGQVRRPDASMISLRPPEKKHDKQLHG